MDRLIRIPVELVEKAEVALGLREHGIDIETFILTELEEAVADAEGEHTEPVFAATPNVPDNEVHFVTQDGRLLRFTIEKGEGEATLPPVVLESPSGEPPTGNDPGSNG